MIKIKDEKSKPDNRIIGKEILMPGMKQTRTTELKQA